MPIVASYKKKEYTAAPEGLWPAVCVDVVDLGIEQTQWGDKHKVQLRWVLDENEVGKDPATNKPFMVSRKFTLSLSERSLLRPFLEIWRGRKFAKEELESFDLEQLLGVNCQTQILHNVGDEGTVYANVQGCVKAARNAVKIRVPQDYVRVCEREKQREYEQHPNGNGFEATNDDVPFLGAPPMAQPKKVQKQNRWGDGKRFYLVPPDLELPSVTTVLSVIAKPALLNWYAKMEREMVTKCSADLYEDCPSNMPMSRIGWLTTLQSRLTKEKAASKELAKAAEIGSQAHALIEWNLKAKLCYEAGPSPKVSDKAMWAFMAWEDWSKSVNLKPVFVEQVVYSKTHGYAGTMDLLAEVNGKLTVLDWKTGKAVYAEAHLQNAAYRAAVREMGHGDPVGGLIVRLPKAETDPEFQVVEAAPERECLDTFLHALRLWTWTQKMEASKDQKEEVANVA